MAKDQWFFEKSESGNTVHRNLTPQHSTLIVITNEGPTSNINCEAGVAKFTDVAPLKSMCLVATDQDVKIFTPNGSARGTIEHWPSGPNTLPWASVTAAWAYKMDANAHTIYRSLDEGKTATITIRNGGPNKIFCKVGVAEFDNVAPHSSITFNVTNQDVNITPRYGDAQGSASIEWR